MKIGAVCVIGAGIAGLHAALELADQGFQIYLIEREPNIGGNMAKLDKLFPTGDCALCILHPKMTEAVFHPNIKIYTYSEVQDISGGPGDFKIKIKVKPKYVDEDACIACGECAGACPIKNIPKDSNDKILKRSAIYIPFQEAVPNSYVIDKNNCLHFQDGSCDLCTKICEHNAINFNDKPKNIELRAGAIIISTGFEMFDPSKIPKYGYDKYPNVITGFELEKMINPFMEIGRPIRPSDKQFPERIAWIKCVGSRDKRTNRYCSGVCCMYIHKHIANLNDYNKLKAYVIGPHLNVNGKYYQEYINNIQDKYDISNLEYEVDSIVETDNNNLIINLNNGDSLEVDLVVLQNALIPSKGNEYFFDLLGMKSKDGFFRSSDMLKPVETGYPGIYFCGCCKNPKDIASSIIEAGAAASKVASLLSSVKGSFSSDEELVEIKEFDPEAPARIGILICHCGINISEVIRIKKLIEYFKNEPNIVYIKDFRHACSSEVQKKIPQIIKDHDLNRFMVASCSPRNLGPLFMKSVRRGGLNPFLFDMVNIRDQCAWVHSNDKEAATEKAKKLISMGIAKSRLLKPVKITEFIAEPAVLVIGAGPAGISAALDLSKQGFYVYLLEQNEKIGGELTDLFKLFPNNEKSSKKLQELKEKLKHNPNIEIFKDSIVFDMQGHVGNFVVTVSQKKDWVELTVGAIIVSIGADEIKPRGRYGTWSILNEVISQSRLEMMLKSDFLPELRNKRMVMIHCAGSRKRIGFTYCSRICCSVALKNAIILKERFPSLEISILYRDITLPTNYEEFEDIAREKGIKFLHYTDYFSPEISTVDGNLIVNYIDKDSRMAKTKYTDYVVLSTSIVPKINEQLFRILRINRDKMGFLASAHDKLRPLDSPTEGIFFCGDIGGPVTIPEAIIQGSHAAMRVSSLLAKETIETFNIAAQIDEDKCIGCGHCAEVCTANVIVMEEKDVDLSKRSKGLTDKNRLKIKKAKIIEANCRGCYKCVVECPVHAIHAPYFSSPQIIDMIKKSVK
ncbi:MAG: FAD-dependent oxidoreductase [Candidatus Lokiarchaeota archaeon]|nr:FAD-dependent oxidoreductase [Candidatus Lokiarchaeota archaeon]